MKEKLQILKCMVCGLTLEVVGKGGGEPVCCGEKMHLMTANTSDGASEKHVPVISGDAHGVHVKVGSLPHPMAEDHYIEWIEVVNGPYVNRKFLAPGEAPEAKFYVPLTDKLIVRAYCNKHGLWKK